MSKKKILDKSLDLTQIYSKKNLVILILWMLLGLFVGVLIPSLFITPKYHSTVDLLVNQKANDTQAQYTVQQADLQAINTYKDVLKKPVILTPVVKEIKQKDNYKKDVSGLAKDISVSNETNSQVLSITVVDSNPYVAKDIANSIGTVFTKKIKKMMKVDNVTIVTDAQVNLKSISPNRKMYVLIGVLLGLLMGSVIIIIREITDTTIKDTKYLTDNLDLISLGQVFHISSDENSFKAVHVSQNSSSGQKGTSSPRRRV